MNECYYEEICVMCFVCHLFFGIVQNMFGYHHSFCEANLERVMFISSIFIFSQYGKNPSLAHVEGGNVFGRGAHSVKIT